MIFWILNGKNCWPMKQLRPETGECLVIFSKHWSNFICFVYFYIFDLLYEGEHQRHYFWTLNLKVLAYEADTAWNRGIIFKILKSGIRLYLFCLLLYCSTQCIKKVMRGKIFLDSKNIFAYEADTAWNRESLVLLFKPLIP